MARQKDFTQKYAPKVLAINPSFSFQEMGCAWAIINCDAQSYGGNLNSPLVLRSGTIKPFTNLISLTNMIELAHKLQRIWEEDSGFSRQPKTVILEKPESTNNSSTDSIRDIGLLCGVLIKIFAPELILAPMAFEWKTKVKQNDQNKIIESSDKISLNNINRDMACIALHNRNNVYDAIGMGIYGGHVTKNQLPLPKDFLRP